MSGRVRPRGFASPRRSAKFNSACIQTSETTCRQESPADARVTRDSAVSRHLGFYRTRNSAIRSAYPENPNMEWIGYTVCEILAFKLFCDLETGVWGHSRSSKLALCDRVHRTLYSSSIVTMPLLQFMRYSRILVENCYPRSI